VRVSPPRPSLCCPSSSHSLHTLTDYILNAVFLKAKFHYATSSELAPNMFGARLVRSWFKAEIWPIIQLASSELARASRFAAKFHYASCFGAGSEQAPNRFGASSESASVMEFGFYHRC